MARARKKQSEIKYNNKYIKSLHAIDTTLEKTMTSFYQANIVGVMKNINQLCQRNSIVELYGKIANKLSSHFNILTEEKMEEQTKNVDVQDDKQLDNFLQRVIVRIHKNVIRVPKPDSETQAECKARELKEKFLKERADFAQILYNKAVTYMANAVQRKKDLSCMETTLFNKMRVNDEKIKIESKNLESFRKANADLIVSLNRDNESTRGNMKRCEVLRNITIKCKEMASIYQSILNSYDEQSQALDRIFTILKK